MASTRNTRRISTRWGPLVVRKYPDLVQEALALYVKHGEKAASAATGVPKDTVRRWAERLRLAPPAPIGRERYMLIPNDDKMMLAFSGHNS